MLREEISPYVDQTHDRARLRTITEEDKQYTTNSNMFKSGEKQPTGRLEESVEEVKGILEESKYSEFSSNKEKIREANDSSDNYSFEKFDHP